MINNRYSKVGAITLGVTALTALSGYPYTMEEIREALDVGHYAEAARMVEAELADGSTENTGELYEAMGEAKYNIPGMRRESVLAFTEASSKGVADAFLYLGRLAMLDYDFQKAQQMFGKYKAQKQKSRKPLDSEFEYDEADLKEAILQFGRQQDIVVIDAVKVPLKEFYKHLRLPLSAGRVVEPMSLPIDADDEDLGPSAFITESGDEMMWSAVNDSTGLYRLTEATLLMDGTLSHPRELPDFLGEDGDAINPFLSADGTTLYFASNGSGTMGGYDIFIASRDPLTGEYLQPVNAGIPFNSSADDYVLAIDEENGVGWWATDRHFLPDGMITLYVYELPETRVNLMADDDEKRLRARLDDIRLTWTSPEDEEGADGDGDEDGTADDETADEDAEPSPGARKDEAYYKNLAAEIRRIQPGQQPRRHDCEIPLGKGRYIYSADDVEAAAQKKIVDEYVAARKKYDTDMVRLREMRLDFARQGSRAMTREIDELEQSVDRQRTLLTGILSSLYRSLGAK